MPKGAPFVSKAQSRLAHAAASNPEVARRTGFDQKSAKKMVGEAHGQKVGKLPEHVERKAEGGAVRSSKPFRW